MKNKKPASHVRSGNGKTNGNGKAKVNGQHHVIAKHNGRIGASNQVTKLTPDKPGARDEGPRLLPLDGSSRRLEHYGRAMELGDIALGNRTGQNKKGQNKNDGTRQQVMRHGQAARPSIKGRPN